MVIKDKLFVVTGAGGGIGRELVKLLLVKGARIIAVDTREDFLKRLQEDANNQNLFVHVLDITNRKTINDFSNMIDEKYGYLDGLINCAGIIQPFVKVYDLDIDDINRVMNVNFFGTVNMTKALLPLLLSRSNETCIVNFSSMGGFLPVPGQSIYGASKSAVKLFTESLYAELLNTNVRVAVVFPGATQTDITKNSGVKIPKSLLSNNKIKMLTARQSANIIISGIEKDKPRIYTGKDSKSMDILYRLNPIFAIKLISKKMRSLLEY